MSLQVTDLFCGAGGSSQGAVSIAGVSARIAANHWERAIETHALNHPGADHVRADISNTDPRYFPTTELLWASPSCTNHSQAQGRKRDAQPDLFGDNLPPEAAERSRATMWDVVRYSEYHQYLGVIVENVVDVTAWAPFAAWKMAMASIGYTVQLVYLNSMHAQVYGPGAPQSRDRFYAVCTRTGVALPDVSRAVSPMAVCAECGPVRARQSFKRVDRTPWGKYRSQYVYRCPNAACRHSVVEPGYRPAADIIDWSMRGTRIGDRTRPLAKKTLERIQAGMARYWSPMLVPVEGRMGKQASPVDLPARTMTTRNETGLLVPTGGTWRTDAIDTAAPMPTRTTRENDGVAFPPFIAELRGGSCDARAVSEALATVTASGNHHALVTSYYGNGSTHPATDPLSTVTTLERHGLVMRNNTGGAEMVTPTHEPIRTVTTAGHQSFLNADTPTLDINDVFFRMLEPKEIVAAMDLTDQAALDRWANEQTGGLIDKFPLEITPETMLVLASALTARVRWRTPFEGSPRVRGETWPDDPGPADQQSLSRTTSNLSIAAVLDDVVTRVVVEGDGDVDVHLLLGTDQSPAETLGAGLRELSGQAQVRLAADIGDRGGPGLTVEKLKSARPKDMLELSLPSFEITTKHNLLANRDLFGLGLLSTSTSHLPRLSPIPLAISGGAQDVLARFFAEGFEAAAVTAFGAVTGALPELPYEITYVTVDFDRPFGFLAVHRPSRLAVVAGWVQSPFQPV